jgi:hypothetical protein
MDSVTVKLAKALQHHPYSIGLKQDVGCLLCGVGYG